MEGLIRYEDSDSVELEVYSGAIKFKRSDVERIKKSTAEEVAAIRRKWQWKKQRDQEEALKREIEEENKPTRVQFNQDSQGILVAVTINKKIKASLIMDTGATLVTLSKDLAGKLKINLKDVLPDAKMIMADGRQVNAKKIILESIEAENVEVKDVVAAVILDDVPGLPAGDGLLGMSFLKRFNFKVDHKAKKLIFEKI